MAFLLRRAYPAPYNGGMLRNGSQIPGAETSASAVIQPCRGKRSLSSFGAMVRCRIETVANQPDLQKIPGR